MPRTRATMRAPRAAPALRADSDVEVHALRERQVAAVVDRHGLAPHVGLPAVGAGLAAAARVLLAAERAADLGPRGADVHVRDPAVRALRRQERLGGAHVAR